MSPGAPPAAYDRMSERRRAVALARHFREVEGLSIAQIADRLARSPATIKAYFHDPTGEKARAVKARYVGVCRGCGAYTQPRNGKGDAYPYCKRCHPGAIECRWTRERVLAAMHEWRERYGRLPSSYDWSRTHARRRGGEGLEQLAGRYWPAASVVTRVFGTWAAARTAAHRGAAALTSEHLSSVASRAGTQTVCVPNPTESTAKSANPRRGDEQPRSVDLQGFSDGDLRGQVKRRVDGDRRADRYEACVRRHGQDGKAACARHRSRRCARGTVAALTSDAGFCWCWPLPSSLSPARTTPSI
jgi:hypothetical protein